MFRYLVNLKEHFRAYSPYNVVRRTTVIISCIFLVVSYRGGKRLAGSCQAYFSFGASKESIAGSSQILSKRRKNANCRYKALIWPRLPQFRRKTSFIRFWVHKNHKTGSKFGQFETLDRAQMVYDV